jgi:serine/threonine-protein kinase
MEVFGTIGIRIYLLYYKYMTKTLVGYNFIGKEIKINPIWFQKYKIIKTLGTGGTAKVFLAEHIKLGTFRAIKKISKSNVLHEQLLNEAHILKNLKNSCIPIIYDFEEDAHNSYIIEQYIEGQSLQLLLNQYKVLPESTIVDYTIQLCNLLQYLYSNNNPILYLDLKPDNIIIMKNEVKLIDFGASSFVNQLNNRKYALGTQGYAAPELYDGSIPDERTDIYGVGSLLYYMVTGQKYMHSHQNNSNLDEYKQYSKKLKNITQKCLRYYPWFRYSTISSLKSNLIKLNLKKSIISVKSSTSISIAIAGTQSRIGTTHLAILITSYFNKNGRSGLYIEKNDSKHILELVSQFQNIKTKTGIYQVYHCHMIPGNNTLLSYNHENYSISIYDYGCINSENVEDFIKCDYKLMVTGAKEWELKATENALRQLRQYKDIRYVFNYLNGRQYLDCVKHMDKSPCYRMPFEPDPFYLESNELVEEFISDLMSYDS